MLNREVGFTPNSRRRQTALAGPKSAKRRHAYASAVVGCKAARQTITALEDCYNMNYRLSDSRP